MYTRRTLAVGTLFTVSALLLTGCGGGSASSASPDGTAAASSFEANYTATFRGPDTTSRPVVKGKKVALISAGQASISSSIPLAAAEEAAKAAGWATTLYDAKLDPANFAPVVRQAIAAGNDAIVVGGIDCPYIKGPLQEAKAKGIQTVGLYAFDCNDPIFKSDDPALFSTQINYGQGSASLGDFTKQYGADQAKAAIAATDGKAQVLQFHIPSSVLEYSTMGFNEELQKCSGCKVVNTVELATADLGPNLQQKTKSALLQFPGINVVRSPFATGSLLGIAPAVVQSGKSDSIYMLGGEGFEPELDLLRNGQGVDAAVIAPSDWVGWAAIDTLNSAFAQQPVVDSGIGWQLVDKENNLPTSGPYVPSVDFKAAYKKAWGLS